MLKVVILSFYWFYYFQVLRVQSADGTKRIEIQPTSTIQNLYDLVHKTFELDDFGFAIYRERVFTNEVC